METISNNTPSRQDIFDALLTFINQRTGIIARNYFSSWNDKEGIKAFRADYNMILKMGRDARVMLNAIRWREHAVTADVMLETLGNGRLIFHKNTFQFCANQYWSIEYRAAACRFLRDCYVKAVRESCKDWQEIKARARKELGRGVANRWF